VIAQRSDLWIINDDAIQNLAQIRRRPVCKEVIALICFPRLGRVCQVVENVSASSADAESPIYAAVSTRAISSQPSIFRSFT
jgi:hypothetical protein